MSKGKINVRWVNKKHVLEAYGGKTKHVFYVFAYTDRPMTSHYQEDTEVYEKLKPVLDLLEWEPSRHSSLAEGDVKNYFLTRDEYVSITGVEP